MNKYVNKTDSIDAVKWEAEGGRNKQVQEIKRKAFSCKVNELQVWNVQCGKYSE